MRKGRHRSQLTREATSKEGPTFWSSVSTSGRLDHLGELAATANGAGLDAISVAVQALVAARRIDFPLRGRLASLGGTLTYAQALKCFRCPPTV